MIPGQGAAGNLLVWNFSSYIILIECSEITGLETETFFSWSACINMGNHVFRLQKAAPSKSV